MTTVYTLPYDPFQLLDKSQVIGKMAGSNADLYKSIGTQDAEEYIDDDTEEGFEVASTSEILLFNDNGVPRGFSVKERVDRSFDYTDNNKYYGYLTDGTARLIEAYEGDTDYNHLSYVKTLAIGDRSDISSQPIALLDEVVRVFSGYDSGFWATREDYEPYVVFFGLESESEGLGYLEEYRTPVTDTNNSYWEGVFQYDINQDGLIPTYRPLSYPAVNIPSEDDANGKVLTGTIDNDILRGKKKDDYLNGKKGNDRLTGKKGEDALFGGPGFDQLYGGKGNDYLSGGSGDDLLEGGRGSDVFVLSAGDSVITDFNLSEKDKIGIKTQYINNFTLEPSTTGSTVIVEGYGSLDLTVNLENALFEDVFVQVI